MATYEVRFSTVDKEKAPSDRRRYPTLFCPSDEAALWQAKRIRRKPFYRRREVWVVRMPSEEVVGD